jgi:hypothetical protein
MREIHENKIIPGYYWMRERKGSIRVPVAIWHHKDRGLVCVAGYDKRERDPADVWLWCAENRISADKAKLAWARGHFDDEPPPSKIGDNLPTDPFERLMAQIDDKRESAFHWLTVTEIDSQQTANLANNYSDELRGLKKQADALFKAEKAPHLAACRVVDDKYAFRDDIENLAAKLRGKAGMWMAREEARLKAEAKSRHDAEMARIQAEREQQRQDDPIAFHTSDAPQLPLEPEPVKVQAGGAVSRKVGLKDEWLPIINDYRAAANHVLEHPTVREAVERVIKHMVRDGKGSIQISGVEVQHRRVPA